MLRVFGTVCCPVAGLLSLLLAGTDNANVLPVPLLVKTQDPNPDDPLNHEAAQVLRDNPRQFESNVRKSMAGGYVAGQQFPRSLR